VSGYVEKVLCDEMRMMYYLACPKCKKKVLQDGNKYRCEQCNKYNDTFDVKYNLTIKISDMSGGLFA